MTKRLFDIVLGLLLLPVTVPLLLILGAASLYFHGRPVFYRQWRAGRGGRGFRIVKLRTMSDGRDQRGELLPDEERLTRYGRWLRSTSLDELPELWNILRGDMSLVGPRPLPLAYLGRYTPDENRRHEVRPGLTGWAQINGRNAAAWEERFELDLWYVDNRSLALDIRILLRTVTTVLRREGISAAGEATMRELRPDLGGDE